MFSNSIGILIVISILAIVIFVLIYTCVSFVIWKEELFPRPLKIIVQVNSTAVFVCLIYCIVNMVYIGIDTITSLNNLIQ